MELIYRKRMERLRAEIARAGLGGVVLVPGPNLRYYTGVDSFLLERPFMMLTPAVGRPQLVAPTLEAGPYKDKGVQTHPWTDSEGSAGAIASAVKAAGVGGEWGVEGRAPFQYVKRLSDAAKVRLDDAEDVLQSIREVKDEEEVKLLEKSASILSRSFEAVPGLLKEGMTERELARAATDEIYANGATKVDDMLVQSGPRAANPHSLPSARKIRRGEGIIVDVGSAFEGYFADITRTLCLGASVDLERVYLKVLEAHDKAIAASVEGAKTGSVDGAARGVLSRAGLGKYFIHRTGHGLGLEIHEAPYIVEGGQERLRKNMCFTVEPGAYIAGKLGVRVEDDALVGASSAKVLTDPPTEFGWWR